ncbi:regulatory protein LysR [Gemmatirosa kalamazoonensis]|uniref:Regulatory protein LysR n=1 Tax=Gemmatirosa kalamazoonensis TaxID=861299 RepID=W0REZ4_9BACT|nr:LysR family transcriptional regulator [Gemmatirosa kalamazoonensis]AHG87948.1 regulatory protein LysR [Gemmatirosa kalamazoonensis]
MELRQLRYLLTVASEGSFLAASRRLRVAQPALSRQVARLEAELGVSLLERGPRTVTPTPAGVAAVRLAGALCTALRDATTAARVADRGVAGACHLCVSRIAIWSELVARIVTAAARALPRVELVISEADGPDQWSAVREGKADIALGFAHPPGDASGDDGLEMIAGPCSEIDGVLLGAEHPLAGRTAIAAHELRPYPMVLVEWLEPAARRAFGRSPLRAAWHESLSVRTYEDARTQLTLGRGWLPFSTHWTHWTLPGMVLVPLADCRAPMPLWAAHRVDERDETVRAVIALIAQEARAPVTHTGTSSAPNGPAASDAALADEDAPERTLRETELRHFRYFRAIVEQGSTSGAAAWLGLTQPALSRQIRALERAVGVPLLARGARGVAPTAAGRALHERCAPLLAAAERFPDDVRAAALGAPGRCVLACASTPIVQHISANALRACVAASPPLTLDVIDVASPMQPTALLDGRCDLALGHPSPTSLPAVSARLRREFLLDDVGELALVSPSHPLAGRDEIRLADLHDLPLLFIPRELSPSVYDRVFDAFARAAFTPKLGPAADGLQTQWMRARAGLGWCLGFRSYRIAPPPGLALLHVADLSVAFGVELVSHRDESREPVLRAIAAIRAGAAEASAALASGARS